MIEKLSRFYLNKKTFLIAIIATLILEPVGMILLLSLGELIPFEVIAYGMLFFLLAGLFITHHKGDYILMNGIVSGILIYEFVRYAYLIAQFTGEDILAYLHGAGRLFVFVLPFVFLPLRSSASSPIIISPSIAVVPLTGQKSFSISFC